MLQRVALRLLWLVALFATFLVATCNPQAANPVGVGSIAVPSSPSVTSLDGEKVGAKQDKQDGMANDSHALPTMTANNKASDSRPPNVKNGPMESHRDVQSDTPPASLTAPTIHVQEPVLHVKSAPAVVPAAVPDPDTPIDPKSIFSTNYASSYLGAKIVEAHKDAKGAGNVLKENKESYMNIPCRSDRKFFTIQLSRDIEVNMVIISNLEFFSSFVRNFTLLGSRTFPCLPPKCMWRVLGSFQGKPVRRTQLFQIPRQPSIRFLRFLWVSHHGREKSCTMTTVQVYGTDALENFAADFGVGSSVLVGHHHHSTTNYASLSHDSDGTLPDHPPFSFESLSTLLGLSESSFDSRNRQPANVTSREVVKFTVLNWTDVRQRFLADKEREIDQTLLARATPLESAEEKKLLGKGNCELSEGRPQHARMCFLEENERNHSRVWPTRSSSPFDIVETIGDNRGNMNEGDALPPSEDTEADQEKEKIVTSASEATRKIEVATKQKILDALPRVSVQPPRYPQVPNVSQYIPVNATLSYRNVTRHRHSHSRSREKNASLSSISSSTELLPSSYDYLAAFERYHPHASESHKLLIIMIRDLRTNISLEMAHDYMKGMCLYNQSLASNPSAALLNLTNRELPSLIISQLSGSLCYFASWLSRSCLRGEKGLEEFAARRSMCLIEWGFTVIPPPNSTSNHHGTTSSVVQSSSAGKTAAGHSGFFNRNSNSGNPAGSGPLLGGLYKSLGWLLKETKFLHTAHEAVREEVSNATARAEEAHDMLRAVNITVAKELFASKNSFEERIHFLKGTVASLADDIGLLKNRVETQQRVLIIWCAVSTAFSLIAMLCVILRPSVSNSSRAVVGTPVSAGSLAREGDGRLNCRTSSNTNRDSPGDLIALSDALDRQQQQQQQQQPTSPPTIDDRTQCRNSPALDNLRVATEARRQINISALDGDTANEIAHHQREYLSASPGPAVPCPPRGEFPSCVPQSASSVLSPMTPEECIQSSNATSRNPRRISQQEYLLDVKDRRDRKRDGDDNCFSWDEYARDECAISASSDPGDRNAFHGVTSNLHTFDTSTHAISERGEDTSHCVPQFDHDEPQAFGCSPVQLQHQHPPQDDFGGGDVLYSNDEHVRALHDTVFVGQRSMPTTDDNRPSAHDLSELLDSTIQL